MQLAINSISIIDSEASVFSNTIHQIRKANDEQIKRFHSPEAAALLRGLLLADRGEIKYQTKNQFINAGVVHVLAVSGLHVGYIILILQGEPFFGLALLAGEVGGV